MMGENKIEWHLNENGASNILIEDLLSFPNWLQPHFKGVFTYFELIPDKILFPSFSAVVNIGRHFVTIYGEENFILYIDPFGSPIPHEEIYSFFSQDPLKRYLYWNRKTVQDMQSSHCGLFAALFTLHLEAKRNNQFATYKDKLLSFYGKNNLLKNDALCVKYIKNIFECTKV